MGVKKELVVSMPTSEESISIYIRKASEEGCILVTHDSNKFVVTLKDLKESIKHIEEYIK